MNKIPVILDTDLGCDIDDAWALTMLLNSPELDLKLVLVGTGDVEYRAKNAAKMLEIAGRTDVPIGLGIGSDESYKSVEKWLDDYMLDSYAGEVYEDGIAQAIDIISQSPDKVCVIGIGPAINLAAMLRKDRQITQNSRLVAMLGSIEKGLQGAAGRIAEYNVQQDAKSAREVFESGWDITITPLDTCGIVNLSGEEYQRIRNSDNSLTACLMEQFKMWDEKYSHGLFETQTSTLFDTVAVYLAYSEELLQMKEMRIRIDDEGFMVEDSDAGKVSVAITWKDLGAFKKHLASRIL